MGEGMVVDGGRWSKREIERREKKCVRAFFVLDTPVYPRSPTLSRNADRFDRGSTDSDDARLYFPILKPGIEEESRLLRLLRLLRYS